jgi:hypothetical protein
MKTQKRKTVQHDGVTFALPKIGAQVADFMWLTPPPPRYLG